MVWKDVEPNVWKPQSEGESISGVLIKVELKGTTNALGSKYYVENTTGQYLVWGSTVLDDRMTLVTIGTLVRITYKGTTLNKRKQEVKIYKVETSDKLSEE